MIQKRTYTNNNESIAHFKGSKKAEEYTGGRTADTIVKWMNDKVGSFKRVKTPYSAVTTLTRDNFKRQVLGKKAAFVEFYAPW